MQTIPKTEQKLNTQTELCSSLLLSQTLYQQLMRIPPEARFGLEETLLDFQRKCTVLLPQQSQQWVMKEMTSPKMTLLGPVLVNHIRCEADPAQMVYQETTEIMTLLMKQSKKAKRIDMEKYRALFDFIRLELEADLTHGTPALTHVDGAIVFKLQSPKTGKGGVHE